jgi:hypothetical protein
LTALTPFSDLGEPCLIDACIVIIKARSKFGTVPQDRRPMPSILRPPLGKTNVSESSDQFSDTAIFTVDGHSCHRTGLRAAELRKRGRFVVG